MATRSDYDTLTVEAFYLAITKQKLLIAQFNGYENRYDPQAGMLMYHKQVDDFIFESYVTLQVIKAYQGFAHTLKKDLDTRFSKAYCKYLIEKLAKAV